MGLGVLDLEPDSVRERLDGEGELDVGKGERSRYWARTCEEPPTVVVGECGDGCRPPAATLVFKICDVEGR